MAVRPLSWSRAAIPVLVGAGLIGGLYMPAVFDVAAGDGEGSPGRRGRPRRTAESC